MYLKKPLKIRITLLFIFSLEFYREFKIAMVFRVFHRENGSLVAHAFLDTYLLIHTVYTTIILCTQKFEKYDFSEPKGSEVYRV